MNTNPEICSETCDNRVQSWVIQSSGLVGSRLVPTEAHETRSKTGIKGGIVYGTDSGRFGWFISEESCRTVFMLSGRPADRLNRICKGADKLLQG